MYMYIYIYRSTFIFIYIHIQKCMNQLLLGHVIENMNKSDRSANGQNRLGRLNAFMGDDIIVKIKTVQAMAIEVCIYI
jgi:hypothetical protein